MKHLYICLLLCLTFDLSAQDSLNIDDIRYEAQIHYQKDNKVYTCINFLKKHEHSFQDTSWEKDAYRQVFATYLSFVGEEKTALELHPLHMYEKESSLAVLKDALPIIIKQAEKEKVILINEAHHVPSHRIFVMKLLSSLQQKGYNILVLEALNPDIKQIADSGIPSANDGYYVKEQTMAWLIRYAKKLGFSVMSYEVHKEFVCDDWMSSECSAKREFEQAKNLNEIIRNHPNAKIVGLVGWEHNSEQCDIDDFPKMAQVLKAQFGINPFTIDQTHTLRQTKSKFRYTTLGLNSIDEKNVDLVVFNNDSFLTQSLSFLKDFYDTKKRKLHVTQINENNKGVLIQIYKQNEKQLLLNNCLPVLQKIIYSNGQYAIYLPKGEYEVLVKDTNDLEIQKLFWKN